MQVPDEPHSLPLRDTRESKTMETMNTQCMTEKEAEWANRAMEFINAVGEHFNPQQLDEWFQMQVRTQMAQEPILEDRRNTNRVDTTLEKRSVIAENSSPDEALPGKLVKLLTLGTAFFWVLAATIRLSLDITQTQIRPVNATVLATTWPTGAGFLHVTSLSCNGTAVLAGTEYSMLTGQWRSSGELQFTDLGTLASNGESTAFAALFGTSSLNSCDVLSQAASSWMLRPIGSGQLGTPVPVPPSWRAVAAAVVPCGAPPCDEAYVAGWDGVGVVLASLKRENANGTWSILPRFRVQPGRGACSAEKNICTEAKKMGKYGNVTALLFDKAGQRLTVLFGNGIMDFWNLPESTLLKRWYLGTSYTAMCRHGPQLLVARDGEHGPVIEQIQMPVETGDVEAEPHSHVTRRKMSFIV